MPDRTQELLDAESGADLTDVFVHARRGFRRDVAALIYALDNGRLIVPLAKQMADAAVGEEQEVGEELSLTPHLLFDADRSGFMPVFTRPDLVERATDRVQWKTDDGPLEYCTLPARVVIELAVALIDEVRVAGLLVNAFDSTELVLGRNEVASIAQGRAIPLVGYVGDIPPGEDEERLIAKMDGPPPKDVTDAIESVLAGVANAEGYRLHSTFNAERDLEPHLTLNVLIADDGPESDAAAIARRALADGLARALEGKLPPPGYIDILFNDPALR